MLRQHFLNRPSFTGGKRTRDRDDFKGPVLVNAGLTGPKISLAECVCHLAMNQECTKVTIMIIIMLCSESVHSLLFSNLKSGS